MTQGFSFDQYEIAGGFQHKLAGKDFGDVEARALLSARMCGSVLSPTADSARGTVTSSMQAAPA